MFVVAILVGLWAIFQSRSSTAAIGFLFLPFYGLFAAGMGWLSANLHSAQRKALRGLGWLCLAAAFAVPLYLAYQGFASIALNARRDAHHEVNLAEIERNKRVMAPEILIDLYRRPVTISGLDRALASNPAVPKEILREIATTTRESFVIQRLLQHPKLDCALLVPIADALQGSERPNDSFSVARLEELKSGQCKFSSGAR